jgi:SAM-dependent methyltransferase
MAENCPLCHGLGDLFYQHKERLYYQCQVCSGLFVDKKLIPDKKTELLRYQEHNNNINDVGYQEFVSPVTSAIMQDFTASHKGLDFGAGSGPVISKILHDHNYKIVQYDPFFHDYPELLIEKYDFIACCEVIEHFHQPKKEFQLLKALLMPRGRLYIMTDLYHEDINFHSWYYKNDITHVFIYQRHTLHWLKENIGFSKLTIHDRLITFSI